MTRKAARKITVTCVACDRPFETTMKIGDPLPEGRCVECAGGALARKPKGRPLIELDLA